MAKRLSKIALAAIVGLVCFGVRAQESKRDIEERPRKFAAEKQRRKQELEKKSTNSDDPLKGLTKVGVIIDSTPLDKPALKVLVSADKEKYKVGDQIKLTVSLLNDSNQELFLYGYLSWGYSSSFTLRITELTGREVMPEGLDDSITPPPPSNDKSVYVKLNPKHFLGTTRIQSLKELNIDRQGKYKVAVDYHSPIPESFGQGLPIWSREMGTVKSVPIQIEVSVVN